MNFRNVFLFYIFIVLQLHSQINHDDSFYKIGIKQYDLYRYSSAIDYVTIYLNKFPNDGAVVMKRGQCYYNLKIYKNAVEDFTEVLRIYKKIHEIFETYEQKFEQTYDLEDLEDPIYKQVSSQEVELRDVIDEAYFKRGNAFIFLKEFAKAIDDFTPLIDKFWFARILFDGYERPKNVYLIRGACFDSLGKIEEAINDYSHAIDYSRNNIEKAEGYFNKGIIYKKLGNDTMAMKDITKAIELDPKNKYAYNSKGDLEREFSKAIHDYSEAIKLDTNYWEPYWNRGRMYFYLKLYDSTLADFDKAIKIEPNFAKSIYDRGIVYLTLNEFNKALTDFNVAILLDPDNANYYYNRGLAYYKIDKFKNKEEYMKDWQKAIDLKPELKDILEQYMK
jgi:tetratricopeptide (TPR) repeat protein